MTQLYKDIKYSQINDSTGLDKINIRHIKRLEPAGLVYLTQLITTPTSRYKSFTL